MTARSRASRRDVLHLLAQLPALPLFGVLAPGCGEPANRARAGRWTELVSDPASAHTIGRAYLRAAPAERDLGVLLAHLPSGPGPFETRGARRERLRKRLRRDFDAGDTVSLHGWVLARTEARLCALVALLGAEAGTAGDARPARQ